MDKLYKFKGNYDRRGTDTNPTLYRDMINYFDNQNNVLAETVNAFLWQPETDYIVGAKVITASMPKGCIAECMAKGTSGANEPTWAKGTINDNGIEWKVYNPTEYDIKPTVNSDKPVTSNGVYNAINNTLNTAIATAQQVLKQAILEAHPVGSIYESTDSTSPEVLFGGTWETMEAGRVLVSSGTTTTGTVYNVGNKGGEETHSLTPGENAPHAHMLLVGGYAGWETQTVKGAQRYVPNYEHMLNSNGQVYTGPVKSDQTYASGSGTPHNNMQPYEVIYRWKRIA